MTGPEPYTTAKGVEDAIKQAARKAAATDLALTTDQRIRLEYFRRFLSRIFSEGATSGWLLKGGTGLLARVPSTRATVDIDLFRSGYSLDEALADLRRLVEIDLADHFRFVYARHRAILAGDAQPCTDGYRVEFDTYIGAQKKSSIGIDLSIGAGLTAEVTVMAPATALDLPRLAACNYRLYPVVNQIADKVCATMQLYAGRPSSRAKDLVDLVVLAVTHDIDGTALEVAIRTEALRRGLEPFDRFVVPTGWGPRTRGQRRACRTARSSAASRQPPSSPRRSSIRCSMAVLGGRRGNTPNAPGSSLGSPSIYQTQDGTCLTSLDKFRSNPGYSYRSPGLLAWASV